MAHDPRLKTLSTRVEAAGGQTADYVEHVQVLGVLSTIEHKLRVMIHDDRHADQAWARVEQWDGTMWHEVVSMRGEALLLGHGIGYRPEHGDLFQVDRDRLLKLALEVLA